MAVGTSNKMDFHFFVLAADLAAHPEAEGVLDSKGLRGWESDK
jgi:hypothetical protein